MSHPMDYRWVIYKSRDLQIGHPWVPHRSHTNQRWVAHGSQDRLQIGQRWISYELWAALQIGHMWVTYSPLHTICRCSQTMTKLLFHEKNWFLRNMMKRGIHFTRHGLQFSRMRVTTENKAKKVIWICQKTAYSKERISQKSFSQNAHESDESLSTHYSRFAQISSVRSFFVIVCE